MKEDLAEIHVLAGIVNKRASEANNVIQEVQLELKRANAGVWAREQFELNGDKHFIWYQKFGGEWMLTIENPLGIEPLMPLLEAERQVRIEAAKHLPNLVRSIKECLLSLREKS